MPPFTPEIPDDPESPYSSRFFAAVLGVTALVGFAGAAYQTMEGNFNVPSYAASLFVGHIAIQMLPRPGNTSNS